MYANTAFASSTLPLPAGVKTLLDTGLTPNTSYSASVQSGNVVIGAGSCAVTDGAGSPGFSPASVAPQYP